MKKYPYNWHVKHDLLFRVPSRKLKNLKKIVQNWLQTHEYYDFKIDVTLNQFILVLYYALRSREFDIRNKDKYIGELINRNNRLREDKDKLEDELKQYKFADYSFQVINVTWSCGDGCCSDNWYEYIVLDSNYKQVDSGGDHYSTKLNIENQLKEKYGSKILFEYYRRDSDSEHYYRED